MAALMVVSIFVSACGGGSGSPATNDDSFVPQVAPKLLSANTFTGVYASPCFAVKNGTNYETGDALYAKPYLVLNGSTGPTGTSAFRFDFYDDAQCATEPLGSLKNDNPGNLLALQSEVVVGQRVATKVRLDFGVPLGTYVNGPTADTVLYGPNLRLKLPRSIFSGFTARDLLSLEGTFLYEGSSVIGSDGYPQSLGAVAKTNKLPALPSSPASPCAADVVTWVGNGATCFANALPTASGRNRVIANIGFGRLGTAQFSCAGGIWQVPTNSTCGFTPAGPTLPTCASQAFNWTQGSESCSGTAPQTVVGNTVVVGNTLGVNEGGGYWSCKLDGTWELWNVNAPPTCRAPAPPITDPKQLAQVKNCLGCHNVVGNGLSLPGSNLDYPSFERIANYYRANPSSVSAIGTLVKSGSVGVFGTTPMPANSQVTDADLAIILPWVLAQPQ